MHERTFVLKLVCIIGIVAVIAAAMILLIGSSKNSTTSPRKANDKIVEEKAALAANDNLTTSFVDTRYKRSEQRVIPTPPKPESTFPEDKMVAGKRTLKNFLATILAPIGKVLWVTGGGWNYDDTGADDAARSIGLGQKWLDFFASEDANYDISETEPIEGKNVFHEKGLDADGYVGWALYNTLFNKNLVNEGFVYEPNTLVSALGDYCDFESAQDLAGKTPGEIARTLIPGDFIIMPGRHMYVVVGSCNDGSLLIAHAATETSTTGAYGGGVQVSSMNEGGSSDCEAYVLAENCMEKYPEWDERYDVLAKDTGVYANFYDYAVDPEANGVFHWKEDVLADPDGYKDMSAEEIIADLYK